MLAVRVGQADQTAARCSAAIWARGAKAPSFRDQPGADYATPRPKNRNPFQCLPVIAFATALSER